MNKTSSNLHGPFAGNKSDNAQAQLNQDVRTPTIGELSIAIEVLGKFMERLNAEAATSIIQLPDTQLGAHYAGKIGTRAIEQTARIKDVKTELRKWHKELVEQSRPGWEQGHGTERPPILVQQSALADKKIENAGDGIANQWGEVKSRFQKTFDGTRAVYTKKLGLA